MTAAFSVVRQKTPYTCGPAVLVCAGRLFGFEFDEAVIADETGSLPLVGTSNDVLQQWAEAHLPVRSVGSSTYQGGLAIWNICNAISGVGHYVLVLGERDGLVRYYDPYWAKVLEFARSEIEFRSGDGRYVEWALNFDTAEDFYDAQLEADLEFQPEWALVSLKRWLAGHSPA